MSAATAGRFFTTEPPEKPIYSSFTLASLVAQTVKRLPTMREAQVQSLGQEDLLDKEMATHSSTLAWKIPWMEEPGRLQSTRSQRVRHDRVTTRSLSFTSMKQIFIGSIQMI